MGYYFNDTSKFEYFDFNNKLTNKNSHKNILIYSISYKALIGAKPLCIWFDKIDGFIRSYDGNRCLVLFVLKKHAMYNRIRYLFSHNYAKVKIGSDDSLPIGI